MTTPSNHELRRTVAGNNHRLASGKAMPRRNVTRAAALLQELLHHPQRHPEPVANVGPSAFVVVVGSKDSFAQIQRERSHARTLPPLFHHGYTIY